MRAVLALVVLTVLSSSAFSAEIRKGAIMQVKADSIWFEKSAGLTEWQKRRKNDNSAAFASYQERLLSNRHAWQFIGPQSVRVQKMWPRHNQVRVEMRTAGARLLGSRWFVDADALVK